jgi:hypothetical protein
MVAKKMPWEYPSSSKLKMLLRSKVSLMAHGGVSVFHAHGHPYML